MKAKGFILFFLFLTICSRAQTGAQVALDQESLPYLQLSSKGGQNIISWHNQYAGVRSIAVQRSADSIRNFTTIGVINAPKKGKGTFKDLHPMVGNNHYRLSIEFGGDFEWFSNIYKTFVDSATIAQAALQNTPADTASVDKDPDEGKASTDFYFSPSSKIFTNPYTGHINIVLDDVTSRRYSIRFFDPSKNEVLRVSRVSKPELVLDKNNFNSRGIFSFQLFDGNDLVETGYVTIY